MLVVGGIPALWGAAARSSELVDAVRLGHTAAALRLIRAGADVSATDSRGHTPLLWAGALGDDQIVRALLKTRAPGATAALRLAIRNGHLPVVQMLVAGGASMDRDTPRLARNPAITHFLHRSVSMGDKLIAAIDARRCRAVPELLAAGAPPGFAGALHRSVKNGDAQCIRALLDAGVQISGGNTSEIDVALRSRNLEAVRMMLATKPPASVIRAAMQTAGEVRRHSLEPAGIDKLLEHMKQLLHESSVRVTASSRNDVAAVLSRVRTGAGKLAPSSERDRILRATDWLLSRAVGSRDVSEEYKSSLVRLAGAVEAGSAPLEDIAAELEAKVDHCRKLGVGMGGAVRLRVVTQRGYQRVDRWQVFYLLKIYEHASGIAPEMFPGWSSPAEGSIEPGRYFVWARDPVSKRTSERVLIRLSGQTEVQLDLPVP